MFLCTPCSLLACGLVTALAAPCLAQDLPPAAVAARDLDTVLVDQPGDGNTWVLAPGYKARFGTDGVEYIPYFGARAPRNFPISFALRSISLGARQLPFAAAASPRIDGERIVYERGAVREIWHLRRDEVEQTFELQAGAGRGELVVRLEVRSELRCTDVDDGLRFDAGALGEVRYGDLTAADATGQRIENPSLWTGDGIELRVPAAFVAAARGAITLDPIVRAITIDTGTDDNRLPDVAHEPVSGNWLVVYERIFSAFDSDIIARRYNRAGDHLDAVSVASGSRESHRPSVAAAWNATVRQFLVVWDEDTGLADRVVLGRHRSSASTGQGITFTVRDTSSGDDLAADVGGSIDDPDLSGRFLVAVMIPSGLVLALVDGSGVTATTTYAIAGEVISDVRVTEARSVGTGWLCVYRTSAGQLFASRYSVDNGLDLFHSRIAIDVFEAADVAGTDQDYLIVYRKDTDNDGKGSILGTRCQFVNNRLTLAPSVNLTDLEPGANVLEDHRAPVVSHDGCRFTYAYLENGALTNYDAFAATLRLDGLQFSDGHRPVHVSTVPDIEQSLAIASEGETGGEKGRYFVAWDSVDAGGDHDLLGALFDGTAPSGGVTVVPTLCGSTGVNIAAQNAPVLGQRFRITADPIQPANQVFLVGEVTTPFQLCSDGCKLGVSPILLTVPGVNLALNIPCDHRLLGGRLAVQGLHVGPLALGGCGPRSFVVPLTTTDTLVFTVH